MVYVKENYINLFVFSIHSAINLDETTLDLHFPIFVFAESCTQSTCTENTLATTPIWGMVPDILGIE